VLAAALVLLPVAGAFAGSGDYGAKGALEQAGQLDLTLEEMLRYALQDEYLARAEYELIMKEYGTMRPFSNIMSAEERTSSGSQSCTRSTGSRCPRTPRRTTWSCRLT